MSSNLILTAGDAFDKFLQGIRKVANRTVPPDQFESWYGDATLDWIRQKLPMAEFNQKRIEDMEKFIVLTDGSTYPVITGISNVFAVPSIANAISAGGVLMSGIYPLYLHGLRATFIGDDNGIEFMAHIRRSEQAGVMTWNKYRKPKYARPYYEYRNDNIYLTGRDSTTMYLEYYRYPAMVSVVNNIDPETNPVQSEEIVQIAVRLFLENRGDPRYKSKLQEMMVTQQGK